MPLKPVLLRDYLQFDPVKSPKELAKRFPSLEYRQTPNGIGVATKLFLPVGTYLGRVDGRYVLDLHYGSDYCMAVEPWGLLEPAAPFGYVNHSCSPNCAFTHEACQDEHGRAALPEVWFMAIRDIEAGSELFIDYGWPASKQPVTPCNCGAPNCRGTITAAKSRKSKGKKRAK